ncbi:hypothetical protein BH09MYX1_BH09MYX1_23090 [soil metagenome]
MNAGFGIWIARAACIALAFVVVGCDSSAEKREAECRLGAAQTCLDLGLDYDYGHGVPSDHAKAKELVERACRMGNAEGCRVAGDMARFSGPDAAGAIVAPDR